MTSNTKSETALCSPPGAVARVAHQTTDRTFRPAGLLTTLPGAGDTTEPSAMTVYDERDNCDNDAPLGCPCPHDPEGEAIGPILWLLVALGVAGAVLWWVV